MKNKKFHTKAVHVGNDSNRQTGAVTSPIHFSSTFKQEKIGVHQGFAMKSGVGSIRIQELNFSKNQKNDLNTPIDRKHSLPIDCRAQN